MRASDASTSMTLICARVCACGGGGGDGGGVGVVVVGGGGAVRACVRVVVMVHWSARDLTARACVRKGGIGMGMGMGMGMAWAWLLDEQRRV